MNRILERVRTLPKTTKWILGSILAALVVGRALLPTIELRYVNQQLVSMEDYVGHVEDIDIALLRGAYEIQGLRLLKRTGEVPVPFVSIGEADISIEWLALFRGSVVAEVELFRPALNFVDGPTAQQSQKKIDSDWQTVVNNLVPFQLNRLAVHEGEIHFQNLRATPPVDLKLTQVEVQGENFSNAKDLGEPLPARVSFDAFAMEEAPVRFDLRMNALKKPMDFDLNVELRDLDLPRMNAFFNHYASLDVEGGSLTLASELAAKDGRVVGYVKPSLKSMNVVKIDKDIKRGPFSFVWQNFVGVIADIFQNEDRQALKIPVEGTLDDPKIGTWSAIGSMVAHAFGKPLSPGVEDSVNLSSASAKRANPKSDSNRDKASGPNR